MSMRPNREAIPSLARPGLRTQMSNLVMRFRKYWPVLIGVGVLAIAAVFFFVIRPARAATAEAEARAAQLQTQYDSLAAQVQKAQSTEGLATMATLRQKVLDYGQLLPSEIDMTDLLLIIPAVVEQTGMRLSNFTPAGGLTVVDADGLRVRTFNLRVQGTLTQVMAFTDAVTQFVPLISIDQLGVSAASPDPGATPDGVQIDPNVVAVDLTLKVWTSTAALPFGAPDEPASPQAPPVDPAATTTMPPKPPKTAATTTLPSAPDGSTTTIPDVSTTAPASPTTTTP